MGKKIYVGNLPFSMTSDSLSEIFQTFGQVDSSNVVMDRETGRSKGFGFVEMNTDPAAMEAIQKLHGSDLGGRPLTVNEARPMEKREHPRNALSDQTGYRGNKPDYNRDQSNTRW